MSKLICPNCGSEVVLPETSTFAMGMTLSKQGNDVHYLNMEKGENNMTNTTSTTTNATVNTTTKESKVMRTAQERLEKLVAQGIDTTGYFALGNTLVRMENGIPVEVKDDFEDEIISAIKENGDVFNPVLDGRFIMAQMFHMLNYEDRWGRYEKGYNAALNRKGYMYQWTMLVANDSNNKRSGELYRLARREREDNIDVKNRYFNRELVFAMAIDYIEKLQKYIAKKPVRLLKDKLEYVRLGSKYKFITGKKYGDVFVADLEKVVYAPYKKLANRIRFARNYAELYRTTKEFVDGMIVLPYDTMMCAEFKDAYKGNGAYYTLNNMIRFHKCTFPGMNREQSLEHLEEKSREYVGEGYKLLGLLKEFIDDNNFEFNY